MSVYRTISFWVCIGGILVNTVILFIAQKLSAPGLARLAIADICMFLMGALAHWYLAESARKEHKK